MKYIKPHGILRLKLKSISLKIKESFDYCISLTIIIDVCSGNLSQRMKVYSYLVRE